MQPRCILVVDRYPHKDAGLHWGVLPNGVSKFVRNDLQPGIMKGDTPTSSGTLKPLLTTEVKGIRSCSSRSMTLELLMETLLLSRVMVLFLSPSSKTGTVWSHGLSQWEQGGLPWEGHVTELVPGVCELQECCTRARSKYVLPLRPLDLYQGLPLCPYSFGPLVPLWASWSKTDHYELRLK